MAKEALAVGMAVAVDPLAMGMAVAGQSFEAGMEMAADPLTMGMAWATDPLAIEGVVVVDPLTTGMAVVTLVVARDLSNSSSFDTLFLTHISNAEYLADLTVEVRLTAFQVYEQRLIVVSNSRAICLLSQRRIYYQCPGHDIGVALI